MRRLIMATVGVAGLVLSAPAWADAGIVPEGAELELLFTRTAPIKGGLTEGPAVAPDGSIYFSDIPFGEDKGMILRFDPKTKKTTVFTDDSGKSNGLMFDTMGRLVVCEGAGHGGRKISRWEFPKVSDSKGKKKRRRKSKKGKKGPVKVTLTSSWRDSKYNAPNDLCIDVKNRIYFTDPRYVGEEERELKYMGVYRIGSGGRPLEVTRKVDKPNGIIISPDQKTLYVADHDNGTDKIDPSKPKPEPGSMKILAFGLNRGGFVADKAAEPKVLVDFGKEAGCDGMTVDVDGNIYLTVRSLKRPGVMIIDPTGKEIGFIPTGKPQPPDTKEPVGLPSNCVFGLGEEKNVLYVTVDKSLFRIRLNAEGFHIPFDE